MPMAVRCAPGMGCARNPRDSTFRQTSRTCSSVAWDFITTNIGSLLQVRLQCNELTRAAAISGNREIIREILSRPRGSVAKSSVYGHFCTYRRSLGETEQGINRGITGA